GALEDFRQPTPQPAAGRAGLAAGLGLDDFARCCLAVDGVSGVSSGLTVMVAASRYDAAAFYERALGPAAWLQGRPSGHDRTDGDCSRFSCRSGALDGGRHRPDTVSPHAVPAALSRMGDRGFNRAPPRRTFHGLLSGYMAGRCPGWAAGCTH